MWGRAGVLYLQGRGFDVHGIDNSPLAIDTCHRRGASSVEVMSITKLSGLGTFDTFVMLGGNFGLLGDRTQARRSLREMHSMSGGGARVVAATRDPYRSGDPDDATYMRDNLKRGRMAGQYRIRVRYRNYCGRWFDHLTMSTEEMSVVLRGTGWELARILDGPTGRYVAILEKR